MYVTPPSMEYLQFVIGDPPLEPGVNAMVAEPSPGVAVMPVSGLDGRPFPIKHPTCELLPPTLPQLLSPSPFAFTALRQIYVHCPRGRPYVVKSKTNGCVVVGGLNAVNVMLSNEYLQFVIGDPPSDPGVKVIEALPKELFASLQDMDKFVGRNGVFPFADATLLDINGIPEVTKTLQSASVATTLIKGFLRTRLSLLWP